jgi:dynein heavy chain
LQAISSDHVQPYPVFRYAYLLELLVTHGRHVLFAGPTGTGKTVYIKDKLDKVGGAGKGVF